MHPAAWASLHRELPLLGITPKKIVTSLLFSLKPVGFPPQLDVGQAEPHGRPQEEVRGPRDPALDDVHPAADPRALYPPGTALALPRSTQNTKACSSFVPFSYYSG